MINRQPQHAWGQKTTKAQSWKTENMKGKTAKQPSWWKWGWTGDDGILKNLHTKSKLFLQAIFTSHCDVFQKQKYALHNYMYILYYTIQVEFIYKYKLQIVGWNVENLTRNNLRRMFWSCRRRQNTINFIFSYKNNGLGLQRSLL